MKDLKEADYGNGVSITSLFYIYPVVGRGRESGLGDGLGEGLGMS